MGFIEEIEENYNQKQEKKLVQQDLNNLKIQILTVAKNGNVHVATELLVDYIKTITKIYTIRDDQKTEMWIYKDGIYIPHGLSYIKELTRKIMQESYNEIFLKHIILKMQTDTYIEAENFFLQRDIENICLKNGILNIKTKQLSDYDQNKIYFTKIPVNYKQNATCPNFIKHLQTVLKYEEDINTVQEMFGYALYDDYKIEKAFMLLGTGRNGKSITLEVLKTMIGVNNCTSLSLQDFEKDQYSKSHLFGKRVNIAGDIGSQTIKDSSFFKGLTGRDLISANRKFKAIISFTNNAKMIFSANQLPRTLDISTAFFDRWILLEFPFTFKEEKEIEQLKEMDKQNIKILDSEIINKLITEEELSGIFNWSLEGLQRIIEKKTFSYSKNTEEVKNLWLRKSDSFTAFTTDFLEMDFEKFIDKAELRRVYVEYCKRYNLKPIIDRYIRDSLAINMGVEEAQKRNPQLTDYDNRIRVWEGLKWKEQYEITTDFTGQSKFNTTINQIKEKKEIIIKKIITKEELINLLQKNKREMFIEDLVKEGLTQEQIEAYTGEGIIAENHSGKINLI